ncbi:unnamed protein product [Sphacelaria rigidula]
MTVRSIVADMAFSNVEKCRFHLALIKPLSRSELPFLSRMYYSLSIGRPDSLHPPLRCLYHPLTSPARVYSSSSLAYTSIYLSTPTWITSLIFSHAGRNVRHATLSRDDPSLTVDLALSISIQACSNSVLISAFSNHPGIRGFRARRGTSFSAALKSTSAKFVASEVTVPPGILCLSSLMMSWVSCSRLSGSDTIARLSIGVRPIGIRLGLLCAKRPRSRAYTMLWSESGELGIEGGI